MTLPVALSGTDVIGQAKTGTGKTLGFGLPLLERVTVPADVEAGRAAPEQLTDAPQALVVVPTRELCTQVTNDLLTAGKVRNVRVLAIYGGRAYEPQVEALRKGVDVIVGTPGRLLDLAGQKKLDLSKVRALVLDEADEMLDLGFLPDVEKIIQLLPPRRQTMLFSATMPGAVIGLARRYMSQPTHIRATAPDDEGATVANITQRVYRAHSMDKPEMVSRILQANGRGLAMIFCRTKRTAADIADQLARRGFASGAVHGDLGQGAREQALRAFRNGKVDVLVCTDVAARGIDVEGVTHVINYQSPEDEKTYLHRIGRTGRAGASGTAVTLVDWDDIPRWQLINKALELSFHDPVETYSTSPHLFEELDIPAGTKGVLPRAERTRAGLAAEELEDLGETGGRGRRQQQQSAAPAERPARTRTPRQRRRTRGGSVADGAVVAPERTTGPDAGAAEETPAVRTPRRRRRTRAGSSDRPAVVNAATAVEPEAPAAPVVPEQSPAPAVEADDAASKPRCRRTRSAKPAAEAVETVTVPEPAAEVVAAPVEPVEPVVKPRRTRTRKAAVAEPVAEAPVVVAEPVAEPVVEPVVAEKPKRTRTVKKTTASTATETAATDAVTAETVATKPARKRTVKKAVASTATEAVAAEVAVAEPVRKRTVRKTTASTATETPEVAEPVAVEKPKRTRTVKKTTASTATETAAAETVATETAATKPARKRTVKKAVASTATESGEVVAEAEKPKRTRTVKKATAEAGAETAEKPKRAPRARKAAVAQPES
ncbi:DEAD/DEAH box helicase [Streptomyces sp. NPDC020875]|uniref:DEAD/DEAH box helicase n=1 Tax=Streptomyces sp. NPDC020875 TaxID=3154898 RepID=UPI0033E24B6A